MLSICTNFSIKSSKYWKRSTKISKITPFINKYNWGGIGFPEGPKDWEKFEQNNKTIALNTLYVPRNTEEICLCANQIIIRVKIK